MTYEFSRKPKNVLPIETKHRTIQTSIPAPGTEEILARLDKVESRSMHGPLPIVWSWAKDHIVGDLGGNKFIDFTSGIFVANVGHSNKQVQDAISVAFDHNQMHAYTYPTAIRTSYLEKLTSWSGFDKAFLLSSGTEATEATLRLMRLHGEKVGKRKLGIVCIEGAFHGRTMGARMMSGKEKGEGFFYVTPPPPYGPGSDAGAHHLYYRTFGQMWEQNADPANDICGFMIETYQGWSALMLQPDFVKAVEKWCHEKNILLCFDEMQSGFGRTGRKFGYEHYGVKPDLICVGKGMGGGVPLSGVLGRADIMDLPEVGEMSSTHSANPLSCAAGLAVIEEIERLELVSEARRKGTLLYTELEKRLGRTPKRWIASAGMAAAVIFRQPDGVEFASRVAERCMQKGLLVVHTGRESIKIGPPLTIPDDALLEGITVLCDCIADIEAES